MPEATKTQSRARITLNSDGRRHTTENALVVFTIIVGLLAFSIGFIVRAHFAGTVLGATAFAVGLYGQMMSSTREQRVLLMAGIIAGFVGLGLSVAHGGFSLTA
jgi:membrane-bound ClpP family serine protease